MYGTFKSTGTVGRISEVRTTKTGKPVTNLSVCVQNANGSNPARWVRVACFGQHVTTVQRNIVVGALIQFEGNLDLDSYEDKDGNKQTMLVINASSLAVKALPKPKPAADALPSIPTPEQLAAPEPEAPSVVEEKPKRKSAKKNEPVAEGITPI